MTTPCDRCVELEARIEALLDELHDVRVALADVGAVREAVARQRHPSTRSDMCDPHGMPRPPRDATTEVEGRPMNAERKCEAEVWEPPGYWHSHQCGNKAKFAVKDIAGVERFVCGIHNRKRQQLINHGFINRDEVAR